MLQDKETPAQELKQKTALAHTGLETLLIPKFSGIKTENDFTALLFLFYNFVSPLEEHISYQIDETILPDIAKRKKAPLLKEALRSFGLDVRSSDAVQPPSITSACEALGAMYVLEGSTLGGKSIIKLLTQNNSLSFTPAQYRYFHPYGEATGPMWASFQQLLNQQGSQEGCLEKIISTANATFSSFKHSILNTFS